MNAIDVSKLSGFTPKEISDLATRGVIPSSGGGIKGKARVFDVATAHLCKDARLLIDEIGLTPADAFRIAPRMVRGVGNFGRLSIRIRNAGEGTP